MRTTKRLIPTVAMLVVLLSGAVQAQDKTMKSETTFQPIFPQGEKLPEQFARYFIGQAYLSPVSNNTALDTHIANVTFEPACRNNWHSHTGGQLLLCTAGRGYYQEQGRPARELHPGDVVEIAPDVVHWHGAAPDSWFSHLAVECNTATNRNTWLEPVDDAQYAAATARAQASVRLSDEAAHNRALWLAGAAPALEQTDPELAEIFGNFAFGDVMRYGDISLKTRILVTMASTVAQHTVSEYRRTLRAALANGITPEEVKEVLYHAVPYVGMAKVADCLDAANEELTAAQVSLPLAPQAVVTPETRMEKGLAVQKATFGKAIDQMYAATPKNQLHIQQFLSANCFGDYQTRPALDMPTRELLTFSILISLGGCEAQVKGHITGNVAEGNDRQTLLAVVTQLLPYIGYPRTLNAIACLNQVIPENN